MPTDIHPPRKVVCILVDGARPDVLRELLAQGDLPNLARWVIEPGGMAVGTTVFPSTTGVAYIPFLFGRYPGPANVPGIRWLDRAGIAAELEARGIPTLRHPLHVWRRRPRASVMVSGNGCAHVYFSGSSDGQTPAELVERLLMLPGVGLGVYRDDGAAVLVARGRLRARLREDAAGVTYEPLVGDPLGLGPLPLTLPDRELLEASRATEFPDAPRQLLQLLSCARSGDLVLAADPGVDFRGPWELPEHRSGHGSLFAEHMLVPIAASVPLPDAALRTVDLMPTMLEILGAPVPDGLDGVPFSRLATLEGALA